MANQKFRSRILRKESPPLRAQDVLPIEFRENDASNLVSMVFEPPDVCSAAAESLTSSTSHQGEIGGCKDEQDAAPFSIDDRSRVLVNELLFPGNDVARIIDKWIYVFDSDKKKLLMEVWATEPSEGTCGDGWQSCENPPKEVAERELTPLADNSIPLPDGRYRFFVSPIRLSATALDYLIQYLPVCGVLCELGDEVESIVDVAVPDPYRWAEDCHDKFFAPRVADYGDWAANDEVKAADMIHRMINTWMMLDKEGKLRKGRPAADASAEKPDAADLADDLDQTEFDVFRKEFDAHDELLIKRVNNAGAYLANWIDSDWHRVVEIAGTETDTFGLYRTCAHWAYILRDLNMTEPTRALVDKLLRVKERFLWTHIFAGMETSESPWKKQLPLNFKSGEHPGKLAQSISGLITNIIANGYPSYITIKSSTAVQANKTIKDTLIAELDNLFHWLDLMDQGEVKKVVQAMEGAGIDPNKFNFGGVYLGGARLFGERRIQAGVYERMFDILAADEASKKAIKHIESAENNRLVKFMGDVGTSLEVVFGYFIAIIEMKAAMKRQRLGQEHRAEHYTDMIGAALGTLPPTMFLIYLTRNQASLRAALTNTGNLGKAMGGRLGPALMLVSGILEVVNRTDKLVGAADRKDYGQIAGHRVALIGAGLMVVGALMMLATIKAGAVAGGGAGSLVAPGLGTAVGAGVGVLGGVVVALGSYIALVCGKSDLAQYVRSCCFGSVSGIEAHWADQTLNHTNRPSVHRRNLYLFMVNFRLQVTEEGIKKNDKPKRADTKYLIIQPGLLSPAASFVVVVYEQFNRMSGSRVTKHVIAPVAGTVRSVYFPSIEVKHLSRRQEVSGLVNIRKEVVDGHENLTICITCKHHWDSTPDDFVALSWLVNPGEQWGLPRTIPLAEKIQDGQGGDAVRHWRLFADLSGPSGWVTSLDRGEQIDYDEWGKKEHREQILRYVSAESVPELLPL